MQATLNFSGKEKPRVLEFLKKFGEVETKTKFEEFRVKISGCSVTLYSSGKLLIQGTDTDSVKKKILQNFSGTGELILGIDETGRGENFGALVVAGVLGETNRMRELRDSKKTRAIGEKASLVRKNALGAKTVAVSAREIDERRSSGENLNQIIACAVNEIIAYFKEKFSGKKFRVIVDGSRIKGVEKAEFIPKADDNIPQVGAASVIAKELREKSGKEKRSTWQNKG
ncbi:MAG: DUF3378 domain-containing protein [Candidatus Diapherotrites archaeon]|nr:DUF3378 domain-containing protein [Candidatus Diapherotrites archaeon]